MAPTLHPRQQQTPQAARIPPDIPADPGISDKLGVYLRNFALWARNGFAEQMRNDEAQQGLMLRGYDTPPGENPAIWMLEVSKAGILGLARMALGSHADPGAFVPIGQGVYAPIKGVTDGSNAAAGDVGEMLSATGVSTPLARAQLVNVVSLTLSAWRLGRPRRHVDQHWGGWDVCRSSRHNQCFSDVPRRGVATPPQERVSPQPSRRDGPVSFRFAACRANLIANMTYYLIANVGCSFRAAR